MAQADQISLGSGFGARSEPEEVLAGIDLSGRVALVTGGYSGIGLETTRALLRAGARVHIPVRPASKATAVLAGLPGEVVMGRMDLADPVSVQRYAERVVAAESKLDLLINNAGIMACPELRTENGWESQFATNHLGHFVLGIGLLPLLRNAEAARVVCLSSVAHRRTDILWDDMHFTRRPYDKWLAYGQSKTANALFALGFDLRFRHEGIRAFSVHPGGILTPLQRHLEVEEMRALGWLDESGQLSEQARGLFKSTTGGCTTTLWAGTSPLLRDRGGVYCEDCDVAELATEDTPRYRGVAAWAASDEGADRLWQVTERMLEVRR